MTIQPTPTGAWQVINGETVIAEYGNKAQALAHALSGQPMAIDEARAYLDNRPEVVIGNQLADILQVLRDVVIPKLSKAQANINANPSLAQTIGAAQADQVIGAFSWTAARWGEVLEMLGTGLVGNEQVTGWIQTPGQSGKKPYDIIHELPIK